jgi:hypothetical protein
MKIQNYDQPDPQSNNPFQPPNQQGQYQPQPIPQSPYRNPYEMNNPY